MLIGIDASRTTIRHQTGTEAYAYHLIRALIPLTAGQHDLRLYFNQPPERGLFGTHPHVEQVVIPFFRLWTHLRLAAELHSRPPDVFFTPAHVIPLTYWRPSVATVHDLGFHYFPEAHTRGQVAQLKWSTRHNARRARRVLADSRATKEDLIRYYHIHADKIQVVYPALDPEFEKNARATKASRVKGKHPYLLFLSTLQPRKNVVRIIEAFAMIADRCPHNLILAGKTGWQGHVIEQALRAVAPEIQNRIFQTGYIAEEGKAPLINGADILLYPSLYEGFGFPVLEANASGTPVIASNTSSIPEVAGDGGALLIDPLNTRELAEATLYLLQNPAKRRQLIKKGLQNVNRFTWEHAAKQALVQLEKAAG
ncbi:MAG: glycosyltransferase family 1 protein [Ardenticatenaceae bacterium]|nr:glycosyltransferase family 1 protein [Ardenticatenaceae bacterium]